MIWTLVNPEYEGSWPETGVGVLLYAEEVHYVAYRWWGDGLVWAGDGIFRAFKGDVWWAPLPLPPSAS